MAWTEYFNSKHHIDLSKLYMVPAEVPLTVVNQSENLTYLVGEELKPIGILRLYRPGYRTDAQRESEMMWISSIRAESNINTPKVFPTVDGRLLGILEVGGVEYNCALFEYIDSSELTGESLEDYFQVGVISSKLRAHVEQWEIPAEFIRNPLGIEEVLGSNAFWGNWRAAPGATGEALKWLERAERKVYSRLADYSPNKHNSNLVHGDLRAANVLKDKRGEFWVIDFDDSVFSWYLWDLCSAVTFFEQAPNLDEMVKSWLRGYTAGGARLTKRDVEFIPDLVMLRRLHIVAWVGSHQETLLAQELNANIVADTMKIAKSYLADLFLTSLWEDEFLV